MDNLQKKYRSGEIEPEEYIRELERRLVEAELNAQALAAAQVDAILEGGQTTPLLLRQAQMALQRSNELLEQHVAERTAALTESEMKYRALFENSLDMIFLTRANGDIVDANPAACRALGMTRAEICASGRAGIVRPGLQLAEGLKRREAHSRAQGELTFIRKDGSAFLAEVDSVILNPEWQDWTTFVTARDITERRQSEEAIQRHTIQLERLNLELETTNQDLEFANRELKDFAHIASHDLQEPLRKVKQFGSLLRTSAETALTGEQGEYLDRMLDASRRMQEMITGLLDYSRITTRGNPFSEVDLAQVVREVLSDLEIRIEQTGGTIEVGDLPVIQADPLLMRQLFQNLISNSLKFHKPGIPPEVKVWAERCQWGGKPGKYVCLHVRDNGIGFDEKHLDKLFIPFVRLQGRSSFEGTGMGLAICRKIAERHGGTITAKSSPGEGATFTVTLKIQQHF